MGVLPLGGQSVHHVSVRSSWSMVLFVYTLSDVLSICAVSYWDNLPLGEFFRSVLSSLKFLFGSSLYLGFFFFFWLRFFFSFVSFVSGVSSVTLSPWNAFKAFFREDCGLEVFVDFTFLCKRMFSWVLPMLSYCRFCYKMISLEVLLESWGYCWCSCFGGSAPPQSCRAFCGPYCPSGFRVSVVLLGSVLCSSLEPGLLPGPVPSCSLHGEPGSGSPLANCSFVSPFRSLPSEVQAPPFLVHLPQSQGLSSPLCVCVGLIGQRTERELNDGGWPSGCRTSDPWVWGVLSGPRVMCAVQPWLASWHCRLVTLLRGWAGRKEKKEKAQRAPTTFTVPSPRPWPRERGVPDGHLPVQAGWDRGKGELTLTFRGPWISGSPSQVLLP